ncbi:MAG TPA: glucose-6-phosphate isomerase, partial [Bacteroidales bacterium]|nr:glucose-6-phosphate isomerase [Bacteroidales bacterium]
KKENKNRIVCITDKEKGALKTLADKKHYKTFVIPDNVGGRFSVLTPVGLLPIALAGFNIRQLIEGAEKMSKQLLQSVENNPAVEYAYYRNYFLKNKLKIEIMATFEPKLFYLIEWWKQLFGESEGKENKGIFPSGLIYTTDLHSMGQYLQQGERMLFETFLSVKNANQKCVVPNDKDNLDKLNYLVGKRISEINRQAELGTIIAHQDGNVPTILIEIDKLNEANLGALIYFFEFACGVSAYTLEVNPFNQPGVEMYKNNMFALLKKEGYEKEHIILQKRLSKKE